MKGYEVEKLIEENKLDAVTFFSSDATFTDIDFWSGDMDKKTLTASDTLFIVPISNSCFVHYDHSCNILINEADMPLLYRLLHNKLKKEQAAERAYTKLLKSIYSGESMQSVLDEYAADNGHFIVVLDVSGRILANSYPVIENTVWEDAVKNGFCDYDFMDHIRSRSKKRRQGSSELPSVYYCQNKALYYLSNRIHISDKHVGNVFMIRRTEVFTEQDYDIITTISRIFGDIIRKEQQNTDVNTYLYGGIMGDLLSGMPESQARSRLKTSGLSFPKSMRVVFLRSLQYYGDRYLRTTLLPKLQSYIPDFPYLVHRDGLIIIADNDKIKTSPLKSNFDKFCTSQHLIAGISDIFSDPILFPEYFEQASSVVKLAQKLNRTSSVLMFRDFAFYILLDNVENQHKLKALAHPALTTLRNYDEEKKSNLFETLKTFISYGFSPTETADAMFLHRNTFNYRKHKIEELCGISLEDNMTRFQLACSYRIFDYLDASFE